LKAPLPPEEAQRLKLLRDYDILDTSPELAFDDLVELAASICDVPIALISLVDETRQWFKSAVGVTAKETSRDLAFCAHAILAPDKVMLVHDARADERFADNMLVTSDPHIRFYAGAPLVTHEGLALGTLCVIDRQPRTLSDEQITVLQTLSRHVVAQLELRRQTAELSREIGERRQVEIQLRQQNEQLAHAEEELQRLNLRHKLILGSVTDGIHGIDLDGNITFENPAAAKMLGCEINEILGKPAHNTIHHSHADSTAYSVENCPIYATLRDGVSRRVDDDVFWRKDGSCFAVEYTTAAKRNASGAIVGAVVAFRDITEQKRVTEEHDRLFNLSLDMLCVASFDGQLVQVNPSWTASLGWSATELTSRPWMEFVHPQDHAATLAAAGQIMHGVPTRDFENRYRCKDGSYRWLSWSCHPLMASRQIFGVARDVTERRQRDEQFRLLETCVSRLNDIVLITEAEPIGEPGPRILYVNDAFVRRTGYSREEALGKTPRILQGPKTQREALNRIRDSIKAWKPIREQLINYTKSGEEFWLELEIVPVADSTGWFTHWIAIERDISERKEAEKRELELQELRTLAMQELERSKEAAEAANTAKSTFLANMSHELRTPLNAVIGYSEMLEEMANDDGNPDYIPDLQKIRAAGKHLLELINSVLDLSKIEAGKMDLYIENIAISPLLSDVAAMIQPMIAKNNNTLKLSCAEDLSDMSGDVTKLRQTLFNLLSNATKFTELGTIGLSARKETSEGRDWVVIDVKDSGIGMTPEQLEKLFQPFQQADASTTRKYGGTGLGLTISRQFCRMMGGDLVVASEFGLGTTFTVRLPLVQKTPVSVRAPKSVRPTLPHLRTQVLLIDDDPVIHELISRNLSKSGCDVHSAENGRDGLQLARSLKPDVIVLDVVMQQTDGWSVLNTLKNDSELRSIPVIMQSMLTDRGMGFALGASDYLIKPVSNSQLLRSVNKYRKEKLAGSVLIVDDDPDLRERLGNQLQKEGLKPLLAENGMQGISMLEEHEVAFIFTDLMMPEMDGMTFIHTVHANPLWKDIPIIVMTAKDLSAEERKELRLAAQLVLEKHAMSYSDLFQHIQTS